MIPEIELLPNPDTGGLIPEEWRAIAGYEGMYEISNYGRVKSLARSIVRSNGNPQSFKEKLLRPGLATMGYFTVSLCNLGVHRSFYVHILVATAFIPNPKNLDQVNHKDTIKINNFFLNFEWVSNRENSSHAWLKKSKSSKYIGVTKVNQKGITSFRSFIIVNGSRLDLGFFKSEKMAYEAYLDALKKYNIVNRYAKAA